MELCKTGEVFIKTDCLGRLRVSTEHRERLLDAFDASGMSGQKFAEHCGVKYTTFATWLQKRRRKRNDYPLEHKAPPEALLQYLAEVEITPEDAPGNSVSSGCLTIDLPGGAAFVLNDLRNVTLAAALINSLSR